MRTVASGLWWRVAYRRAVTSAFRTVPLYREVWALSGRTDPVLVPGRTGVDGGAVRSSVVRGRLADLVPLAGGAAVVDPTRGLDHVRSLGGFGRDAEPEVVAPDELARAGGKRGVLRDPLLGFLGASRSCGEWHLDWPRVYARATGGGLAVTLLAHRSPMLVDVLVCDGVAGEVVACPVHGTPVVRT
ncbi:hypothetical protein [Actinophytocola xinjiangensis]|uniref:hypothetical protein n=1 Tax=Actinophytocola xinjiangensis TaxID=485602 RepID=UPI0012B701DE|nr:hypothetical protein [Actinophytocola xinjiangensis]